MGLGAIIGATAGSIIPGVGTAVGATAGGALEGVLKGATGGGTGAKKEGKNSGVLKKLMGGIGGAEGEGAEAAALAMGIGKTIAGKIKTKKADQALPMQEDPEERKLQRSFARKKRAFQSGTALESERAALKEIAKQGMTNSFRVGGGTKGLAMMSRMFNEGMRDLASNAQAGESQYAQMEQAQVAKLADRKLQLNLLKYNTKQARAAQTLKEGKTMLGGSLSRILGVGTPYEFGATNPTTPATPTTEETE